MKKIIIVMALLAASTSQAKSTVVIRKEKEGCLEAAVSTFEIKECAWAALKDSDTELKAVYRRIKSSVESGGDEDSKEISSRLVKAQRAWLAFTEASCKLDASDMLGGTGESMIYLSCLADSTIQRVDELNSMFTDR